MRGMLGCFSMAIDSLFGQAAFVEAEEGKNSIVGTWKILTFSRHDVATGSDSDMWGHPTGHIAFTPGGHVVVWLVGDSRHPLAEVRTDAERLAWFKDIISGYSGTYTIEQNRLVMHVETAWVPDWYGTDQTRYFSRDGNKLVVKTAPFKSPLDGREVVNTLVFERVE
jgi:hypothetical protein